MLTHELPFARVQAGGLEQHAVGHADLADVVQVGGLLDLVVVSSDQPLVAEQDHVGAHARRVAQRVVVLGVQGRLRALRLPRCMRLISS